MVSYSFTSYPPRRDRQIAGREGRDSEGRDMLGLRLLLQAIIQLGEDGTLIEIGVQKRRLVD